MQSDSPLAEHRCEVSDLILCLDVITYHLPAETSNIFLLAPYWNNFFDLFIVRICLARLVTVVHWVILGYSMRWVVFNNAVNMISIFLL